MTDHYSKITVDDFLYLGAKLEFKMHACISSISLGPELEKFQIIRSEKVGPGNTYIFLF